MKKSILFSLLLVTALGGCSRVKSELGLTRHTPDEFAVVRRAPLEMPPNLKTETVAELPAPRPGAQRPQEFSPEQSAQAALLSAPVPVSDRASSAESSILQKAGANNPDPNIRNVVDREAVENKNKNRPVAKRIMNWGNKQDPGAAVIVDAPAEARRIKQKQSGETPSIEQ